jgi:hypothetical protein
VARLAPDVDVQQVVVGRHRTGLPVQGRVAEHGLAQPGEGPGQQPRHVHLRDAEIVSDVGLGAVAVEPHGEDASLPLGQAVQQRADRDPVVDRVEIQVRIPDQVTELRVAVGAGRRVQRDRRVGRRRLQRTLDVVFVDAQVRRDLGGGRRAPQFGRQVGDGPVDVQAQLLHASGHVDAPRPVAEVPAQLADDGDRREPGERTPGRVVPVDRLEQADPGHLFEVVEGLTPAAVTPGESGGER